MFRLCYASEGHNLRALALLDSFENPMQVMMDAIRLSITLIPRLDTASIQVTARYDRLWILSSSRGCLAHG